MHGRSEQLDVSVSLPLRSHTTGAGAARAAVLFGRINNARDVCRDDGRRRSYIILLYCCSSSALGVCTLYTALYDSTYTAGRRIVRRRVLDDETAELGAVWLSPAVGMCENVNAVQNDGRRGSQRVTNDIFYID